MFFSILMLLGAVAFTVLGILLLRGRTELIHSYHRTHVTDHAGYGRAHGVAALVLADFLLLAGVLAWLTPDGPVGYPLGAVFVGLAVYGLLAGLAQRRYNRKKAP